MIQPNRVAELLILRPDMPRSLLSCMKEVMRNLAMVSDDRTLSSYRNTGKLCAELEYASVDEILANSLHAYLTRFLDRVNDIGFCISKEFLVPS